MIYIYDSYVFPSNAWYELLSEGGNLTLRGTEMDAIYIGLLVEPQHKNHIKKSHFDGFYTYFAINNFSYGSTWKNWRDLNKFAEQNGLLFIPSVGPGYIDTRVGIIYICYLLTLQSWTGQFYPLAIFEFCRHSFQHVFICAKEIFKIFEIHNNIIYNEKLKEKICPLQTFEGVKNVRLYSVF